jgi:hypothetical protein
MYDCSTIFAAVQTLGVEIDNHGSDLYIPVTDATRKLIAKYEYKDNIKTFTCNKSGFLWYDIPFGYQPWWDDAEKQIDGWVASLNS